MSNLIAINYDETSAFGKQLRNEGNDIVQLYSNTRQRVEALRNEWIGDAAEAFHEEMEAELLPALQRVSGALFLCDEVLLKVMKIIHEADEETTGFFKDDLDTDFGAGLFGLAGAGLSGVVGPNLGDNDFGAGKFEDALGEDKKSDGTPPAGTPPPGSDAPASQPAAPEAQKAQTAETPPAEAGGGGGGGGGDSGSHGIQGDLKGLGTGVGNQVQQQVGAAGSNPQNIPDHIFSGNSSTENVSPASPAPAGTPVVPGEQASPSSGVATAAGAAGVAGAAAVGSKVLKENQDQSE
jgi:WXG100 family type VII secretion target